MKQWVWLYLFFSLSYIAYVEFMLKILSWEAANKVAITPT